MRRIGTILAAVAHPDDIEFMAAGTLLLLQQAGYDLVFWNLADGSCGATAEGAAEISERRQNEAKASAKLAGARWQAPLFKDLHIFHDEQSLKSVGAVIRQIAPDIIFTHSPRDYFEDHEAVCRLVTTAAFARGMPNFETSPKRPVLSGPLVIYHALPHGLRDSTNRLITPSHVVDIQDVLDRKEDLLRCHDSQFQWLGVSQEMPDPVETMRTISDEVGQRWNGNIPSEGFIQHNHLGFTTKQHDPLKGHLPNRCRLAEDSL